MRRQRPGKESEQGECCKLLQAPDQQDHGHCESDCGAMQQLLIQNPKFVKKMGLGETRDVVVSTFIVAAAAVIGLEWWNRRQQVNSLLSISSICISFWL